jgi:hypothetical protein
MLLELSNPDFRSSLLRYFCFAVGALTLLPLGKLSDVPPLPKNDELTAIELGPSSGIRVHAKLDLWGVHAEKGYIGNQMFIFMSTIGIAVHNGATAVFTRAGISLLEETFFLDHLSKHVSIEDSSDPFLPSVTLDNDEPMPLLEGDVIVQHYLQNYEYMQPAAQTFPNFWRFRPRIINAAMNLLNNHTNWVCVHMRHFSPITIEQQQVKYPPASILLPYIQSLMKPGKCVMVFGNDVNFSRTYFAPLVQDSPGCIVFVDPGPIRIVVVHGNEVHPDSHASRDLAALSLCDDIVSTVGTYSYWAMSLHKEGRGNAHYFVLSTDKERFGYPSTWISYG